MPRLDPKIDYNVTPLPDGTTIKDRDEYLVARSNMLSALATNAEPLQQKGGRVKSPIPLGSPPHPPKPPETASGVPLYKEPEAPAPRKYVAPPPPKARYDGQATLSPPLVRERESEPIVNRKKPKKANIQSKKTTQAAKKPTSGPPLVREW